MAQGSAARCRSGALTGVIPHVVPEMARLGNDSLVLLLLSLAWVVTRKAFDPRGKTFHFALLGVVCGLGLLT